jgi:hypothetical protein
VTSSLTRVVRGAKLQFAANDKEWPKRGKTASVLPLPLESHPCSVSFAPSAEAHSCTYEQKQEKAVRFSNKRLQPREIPRIQIPRYLLFRCRE